MRSNLKRQVFDKKEFNNTVDNKFNQLVSTPDPSFYDINLASIDDFFALYDKFFYDIPRLGENNSHEYLYKTSRNYVGFEDLDEQIKVLLEEITSLREENLSFQEENINMVVDNKPSKVSKISSQQLSISPEKTTQQKSRSTK